MWDISYLFISFSVSASISPSKKHSSTSSNIVCSLLVNRLQFNIHFIEDDFDVFVAFETMNNRGKKLSNLEILKNRLIYLTTIFPDSTLSPAEKTQLRSDINSAWSEVYYELGRNKNHPLSDDDYLKNHWILYFKYSRQKGDDYIRFLLNDFFTARTVYGIAAGVGFGAGDITGALIIAGGIALQNVPEGMVIIAPMLAAGVKLKRTFVIAAMTGLVEVVGTLIGYFAVSISSAILPFALAFAGGTMLYVISDEMIPETHAHGSERGATYSLLIGFCLMLAVDVLLG